MAASSWLARVELRGTWSVLSVVHGLKECY